MAIRFTRGEVGAILDVFDTAGCLTAGRLRHDDTTSDSTQAAAAAERKLERAAGIERRDMRCLPIIDDGSDEELTASLAYAEWLFPDIFAGQPRPTTADERPAEVSLTRREAEAIHAAIATVESLAGWRVPRPSPALAAVVEKLRDVRSGKAKPWSVQKHDTVEAMGDD